MVTVTFTNNRPFDLRLWVYDLNAGNHCVHNGHQDPILTAGGGSYRVQVQDRQGTVSYHWSVMENILPCGPRLAWHGAGFEINADPTASVTFLNPNPPLFQLPSMFRPYP